MFPSPWTYFFTSDKKELCNGALSLYAIVQLRNLCKEIFVKKVHPFSGAASARVRTIKLVEALLITVLLT